MTSTLRFLQLFFFLIFAFQLNSQNPLSKKETLKIIDSLSAFKNDGNFEELINTLNERAYLKSLEVKNKKYHAHYDTVLETYSLKSKLFSENDSIVDFYWTAINDKNYFYLLSMPKLSLDKSNSSNSTRKKWYEVNIDLPYNYKARIGDRSLIVDSTISSFEKGNFDKCLNYSNRDSDYTDPLKKPKIKIIEDSIVNWKIQIEKFKSEYIYKTQDYLLQDFVGLPPYELLNRINHLEKTYNQGDEEINNLIVKDSKLLKEFTSIKPFLLPKLEQIRTFNKTKKLNSLPDSLNYEYNLSNSTRNKIIERYRSQSGNGGSGSKGDEISIEGWAYATKPSTRKIKSTGTARIDFVINREGKIIKCEVNSPTFTQEEKQIIKEAFMEQATFKKTGENYNQPLYKGTFIWEFKF